MRARLRIGHGPERSLSGLQPYNETCCSSRKYGDLFFCFQWSWDLSRRIAPCENQILPTYLRAQKSNPNGEMVHISQAFSSEMTYHRNTGTMVKTHTTNQSNLNPGTHRDTCTAVHRSLHSYQHKACKHSGTCSNTWIFKMSFIYIAHARPLLWYLA